MADRITRTTHQSYFSRLTNSFFGILIGLVLVPGSVILMSWNEYRTVHRARGLIEAEGVVAEVADPLEIIDEQEGRLVHLTGKVTSEETLTDVEFSIMRQALRLERHTEMYQWVEHEESRTRDRLGGGRETVKTYEYRREWRAGRENSSSFEEPTGHENPQPRYSSKSLTTDQAKLGAFRFRPELVNYIDSWQDIALDQTTVLEGLDPSARDHFRFEGDRLYYSAVLPASNQPQIGDMRIKFRVVEPTVVSVLSKQHEQSLEPFETSNSETIESVQVGVISATGMFDSLRRQNIFIARIIRVVGWFLACMGCGMIIAPLKTFASIIPLFGRLVGVATFGIAFVLGSVVTLMTIAVAWIAVRPIFGVTLIVFAIGGIYLLSRWSRRSSKSLATTPLTVPPPLPTN